MVEKAYSRRRCLNGACIISNITLRGFVFVLMGGEDCVCSHNLSLLEGQRPLESW